MLLSGVQDHPLPALRVREEGTDPERLETSVFELSSAEMVEALISDSLHLFERPVLSGRIRSTTFV